MKWWQPIGWMILMTGGWVALCDAQEPAPPAITPEGIEKAVINLGHGRFVVREQASKYLEEAGAAAEKALQKAVTSTDAEVAMRARVILERFAWGIYPDTPPTVLKLIDEYKVARDRPTRAVAVSQLLGTGKDGLRALRRILPRVEDQAEREEWYRRLSLEARRVVPKHIVASDFDGAEELLEIGLLGTSNNAYADYAVLMSQNGKLDKAIQRFELQRSSAKDEELQRICRVLAHLYRVKADWPNAKRVAKESEDTELLDAVLWEMSDWQGLADSTAVAVRTNGNIYGMELAYERLAGNTERYRKRIDEIKEALDKSLEDSSLLREMLEGLLLNGEAEVALELLRDKQAQLPMLFDLLCAQLRYKEAFALADAARGKNKQDPDERDERDDLELRRARMLYMLGDRESATQLFSRMADGHIQRMDFRGMRDLIRIEMRLGMRDVVLTQVGRFFGALAKQDIRDNHSMLLDLIYRDDKSIAETVWLEMLFRNPEEDPASLMLKVDQLLMGHAEKTLTEWTKDMDDPGSRPGNRRPMTYESRLLGLGHIYLAHRKYPEAERVLQVAAEKFPFSPAWMKLGDLAAEQKQYRVAAERYAKAFEKSPANPLPVFLQGLALQKAGDDRESKRLIEIAHRLPLSNEEQRGELAEQLAKRGHEAAARRETELVLKTGWYRDWHVGNVLNQAARWSAVEKNYGKAADYYERSVVGSLRTGANYIESSAYLTVPQMTRAYRARSLVTAGKFEEGIALVDRCLKVLPGNLDLAIAVVPELEKAGKKEEASRIFNNVFGAYNKLCTDFPNSGYGHNSAAWLAAGCKRELDKGLEHAQKAVAAEPKNSGYLDTLAEVHFRRGEKEEALKLMKKCVEMDRDNSYYRKQLIRFEAGDFDSPVPADDD